MEVHKIIMDFGIGNQIDKQKTIKLFAGNQRECDQEIKILKSKYPQESYLIK